MEEIFVTKIKINSVHHLEGIEILLSDTERKHLILTGKNGSGKTSVMEGIVTFLNWMLKNEDASSKIHMNKIVEEYKKPKMGIEIAKLRLAGPFFPKHFGLIDNENNYYSVGESNGGIYYPINQMITANTIPVQLFSEVKNDNEVPNNLNHSREVKGLEALWRRGEFILKFFEAKRDFDPKESGGPKRIDIERAPDIRGNVNKDFVQHLINQRFAFLDLKDRGEIDQAEEIENWFQNFERTLKNIFEDESLEFVLARPNFNYNIVIKNRNPFNINQLSDGYGMFLSIISEIMMRMDNPYNQSLQIYDLQGIVLIDEIETHLHIDLQKKILPFLTAFFPKIQFIVTTHSPFVLSSIDNAVIYDLEKQQIVEDLSDYSYQEIVETYFGTDQYSDLVKKKLSEYESLIQKSDRNKEDENKIYELRKYFRKLPFFLSPELQLKIQALELYPEIAHT